MVIKIFQTLTIAFVIFALLLSISVSNKSNYPFVIALIGVLAILGQVSLLLNIWT